MAAPRSGPPAVRRRQRFLPPQHGAWAMLLLPFVAAVVVVGATWVHLPLLGAWLGGYLLTYYSLQAVKARRPRRYRDQVLLFAGVTLPLALLVVWARPAVLWYAPVYAVLLSVNAWYAWRRRERAVLNDLASVVQSGLLVFLVATVAGAGPGAVGGVFVGCTAYLAGTVFYVKTMIRERGNRAFGWLSVAVHAAALAVAVWLGPWLAIAFAWLLIRAWLAPGRPLSAKQVGLLEVVSSVLVLVALVLTYG